MSDRDPTSKYQYSTFYSHNLRSWDTPPLVRGVPPYLSSLATCKLVLGSRGEGGGGILACSWQGPLVLQSISLYNHAVWEVPPLETGIRILADLACGDFQKIVGRVAPGLLGENILFRITENQTDQDVTKTNINKKETPNRQIEQSPQGNKRKERTKMPSSCCTEYGRQRRSFSQLGTVP